MPTDLPMAQTYELVDVASLVPHPENPRKGDVDAIAASIDAHGFYGAVVAQVATGHVLAGNHRLLAAQQQGIEQVPVLWLDVDDATARRILLVDNRTNERATWDFEALAAVLAEVQAEDADLAGLGWDEHELEALLGAEWQPPVQDDNFDEYEERGARRSLSLTVDAWVVIDSAVALVREREGDPNMSEEAALVHLCKAYADD
jgi:hypothetical protein